jgi:hypothetical protein
VGTIVARRRSDGTTAYLAQIQIRREGIVVFRESKTFDRRQAASAWLERREREIEKAGGLQHAEDPLTGETVDDGVLEMMRDAVKNARQVAETMETAVQRIRANRMQTPAAKLKQAREVAFKLWEKASRTLDATYAAYKAEIEKIEAQIAAPAKPKNPADMMLHSEIRAALLRMSRDERSAAVHDAIVKGDDAIVGAILHGHGMLSGLPSPRRSFVAWNGRSADSRRSSRVWNVCGRRTRHSTAQRPCFGTSGCR